MSMLGVGVASRLPGCTPYVNSSLDSPTLYKYDRQNAQHGDHPVINLSVSLSLFLSLFLSLQQSQFDVHVVPSLSGPSSLPCRSPSLSLPVPPRHSHQAVGVASHWLLGQPNRESALPKISAGHCTGIYSVSTFHL